MDLHHFRIKSHLPAPTAHESHQIAPSALVAAFLHSPYGFTPKTLEITVEQGPETTEVEEAELEKKIRSHFIFEDAPYKKWPLEKILGSIETMMQSATIEPQKRRFPEKTRKAGPEIEM